MRRRALLAAILASALLPASGSAQRAFDVGGIRQSVDNQGLLIVERAETPGRFEPGAGLLLSYTHAPLRLRYPGLDGVPLDSDLVRGQVSLDLGLSLGIWDFLAVAASFPVAAQWFDENVLGEPVAVPQGAQSPTPATVPTGVYRGQPRQNVGLLGAGPRDGRLSIKGRIFQRPRVGVGLLVSATVPLGDAASFLSEGGATLRPLAIVHTNPLGTDRLTLAINLGAVLRPRSELRDPTGVLLLERSHELYFALGAALRLHRVVAVALELWGTAPLTPATEEGRPLPGDTTPPSTQGANVDALGVVFLSPVSGLRLSVGAGGGLVPGSALRDPGRVVLEISWSPTSRQGGPGGSGSSAGGGS
jgi:hypothetical protein